MQHTSHHNNSVAYTIQYTYIQRTLNLFTTTRSRDGNLGKSKLYSVICVFAARMRHMYFVFVCFCVVHCHRKRYSWRVSELKLLKMYFFLFVIAAARRTVRIEWECNRIFSTLIMSKYFEQSSFGVIAWRHLHSKCSFYFLLNILIAMAKFKPDGLIKCLN